MEQLKACSACTTSCPNNNEREIVCQAMCFLHTQGDPSIETIYFCI